MSMGINYWVRNVMQLSALKLESKFPFRYLHANLIDAARLQPSRLVESVLVRDEFEDIDQSTGARRVSRSRLA